MVGRNADPPKNVTMTFSELNRKLLFHGQQEVTDYLRNSPLNRFLYKKFLGILSASGIEVPMVTLFNEIYYQCVRINYDLDPGVDPQRRYWAEEATWLHSSEGAQLVFCAVWALLCLKREHPFHEECFLSVLAPYLRNSAFCHFAEDLAQELHASSISVPDRFPVMTCPVSEIVPEFSLTKEQDKSFWGYNDPSRAIIMNAWQYTWANVTCNYAHSVIEKYVRLYPDQDDQLKLIACMKEPLYPKKHPEELCFLKELSQRITTGSFDPEDHPLLPPTPSPETDEEEADERLFCLLLEGTEESRNLDLAKRYREERDALRSQLEEMQKSHDLELARLEAEYKAVTEDLLKENGKLIHWPSKKKPKPLPQANTGSNMLVFSINDVVAHVKERFSKSAGEEISTMLYRFALEYGVLTEETFKLIDSIMPAIQKRDLPQQTFEFANVSQFNNNPGTVVNGS